MVSSTTLILISTVVQTIVITCTLLVFIFQFRAQEKATKEASYQSLMGRYNDFIMTQAANPDLGKLLVSRVSEMAKDGSQVSKQQASMYGHMLIAYGILEEAFQLYDKKWIDQQTWDQWDAWLKAMLENAEFVQIHELTAGMFDKGYQEYVSGVLRQTEASKPASPQG